MSTPVFRGDYPTRWACLPSQWRRNRRTGQERNRNPRRFGTGSGATVFTFPCRARSHGLTQLETGQRLSRLVHPSSVSGVPLTTIPKTSIPRPVAGRLVFLSSAGREKDRYVCIPNSVIPPSLIYINYQLVMWSSSYATGVGCAVSPKASLSIERRQQRKFEHLLIV